MKRALFCLVFLASASEASALEVSFDEEARALVAVGVPEAPAEPLEAARDDDPEREVAAEAPAPAPRELWRHPSVYRDGQAVPPEPVVTRVGDDDVSVYCVNSYLYEADARAGVVRFRRLLPGACVGLALDGASTVTVTLDPRFLSFHSENTKPPAETTTLEYTVGEHARGADVLPKIGMDSQVALAQAANVLSAAAGEGAPDEEAPHEERREWLDRRTTFGEAPESTMSFEDFDRVIAWRAQTPEGKAWSERARALMAQGRERDPTNPWFAFYEGMVDWEQGRKDEALATWEGLREVPHDLAHETLRMLPMLARVGAPAPLIEEMRAGIARSFLRNGYEPELSRSLIWLALNWRSTGPKLDVSNPRHLAIADSYAEDWHALMPNMEGTRAALRGMARAHREAGDDARADELERRADAHPGDLMGSGNADIDWAMYALPIPPAVAVAVALLFLVGLLRRAGARWVPQGGEGKTPWWLRFNPLSTTHRGALAGMLALSVAAMYVTWKIAMGVVVTGVMASAPIDLDTNRLGADEVGAYLEGFEQTPDVLFYRGLHHQHAHRTERAEALYEESGTARAWNNIGVLAHRSGDTDAAQRAWAEALERDPGLEAAVYNTRGEVTGARSARMKEYAPELEMSALPTPLIRVEMSRARARARLEEKGASEVLGTPSRLGGDMGASDVLDAMKFAQSLAYQVLVLALLFFGMLAPRRGYELEARDLGAELSERALAWIGLLGWLAGLLTPGGAHALGALRPWLLGATLTSAALHAVTSAVGGETSSILLNLSTPSFNRMLGVQTTVADSAHAIDGALMSLGEAWWMLALGCLLAGFVAEHLRPDPVGLIARRRAGRRDAEA